jgi:hypothetical protein
MENSFNYIIRSNQREDQTDTTNNCTIRLGGLPQQYRYFEATVVGFYVALKGYISLSNTLNTVELQVEGLNILNGFDTQNNVLKTIAFTSVQWSSGASSSLNSYETPNYKFKFENCNGKSVHFKLCDENNDLLKYGSIYNFNKPWSIVLKLKGYN